MDEESFIEHLRRLDSFENEVALRRLYFPYVHEDVINDDDAFMRYLDSLNCNEGPRHETQHEDLWDYDFETPVEQFPVWYKDGF